MNVCEVESEFKRCNKCDLTKLKSEFHEDKAKKYIDRRGAQSLRTFRLTSFAPRAQPVLSRFISAEFAQEFQFETFDTTLHSYLKHFFISEQFITSNNLPSFCISSTSSCFFLVSSGFILSLLLIGFCFFFFSFCLGLFSSGFILSLLLIGFCFFLFSFCFFLFVGTIV